MNCGSSKAQQHSSLEAECQAAAEAALSLRKDQHRSVIENIGTVALGKQVAQADPGVNAARTVAAMMNRLPELQVEEWIGSVPRELSNRGHCRLRLPAVRRPPACA